MKKKTIINEKLQQKKLYIYKECAYYIAFIKKCNLRENVFSFFFIFAK